MEKLSRCSGNMLLGKFDNHKSVEEGVLYWDKQNICYYDVKTERSRRMSAPQVRNFLAGILELGEERAINE